MRGAAETLEDEISTDLVELVDQLCDRFETGYDNDMICVVVVDTKATSSFEGWERKSCAEQPKHLNCSKHCRKGEFVAVQNALARTYSDAVEAGGW